MKVRESDFDIIGACYAVEVLPLRPVALAGNAFGDIEN